MRMIKFPSIEQYRNVVRNVRRKAQFVGLDDNNEPIIDTKAKLPVLDFEGTVKLHGTNAGVVIDPECTLWAQSRKNIITPEADNAGFAMFVHNNSEIFRDIVADSVSVFSEDTNRKDIAIYGEWCGQGIQNGVAICQLPKMFIIFDIALVDAAGNKEYLPSRDVKDLVSPYWSEEIKTIYSFPTWRIKIDFDQPELSQNELNAITEQVEAECPVGKALGVCGVGEGVVWKCTSPGYTDSGFWFKVKGQEHSKSKVKTLAKVDVERIQEVKALAETLAHNGRLEQMHQEVFDTLNGGETDIRKMGDFIKAVMGDIFKEEADTVAASGFSNKELGQPVFKICRDFINNKLN